MWEILAYVKWKGYFNVFYGIKIIEISQRDKKTGRCGLFINIKKIKSVLVGKKG